MSGQSADGPRAVIVISSHVVRGSVGNRAAVFVLETLGHPVWAVPTVVLPWHPGHGRATRIVADPLQFDELIRDLATSPWLGEVAAVLSGYLGDPSQAQAVAGLIRAVKERNRAALYVCDPVIGDSGGLYVPAETAAAIRDHLLPLADIATPNRYELEWLAGASLAGIADVVAAALDLGPPAMLVTSVPAMMSGSIGNLLLTGTRALLAEHRVIERPPNGLGDLTAALFLARRLADLDDARALQSTVASVFEILARSVKRGADELMLETDASSLSHPMAMVQLRHLVHPSRGKPT